MNEKDTENLLRQDKALHEAVGRWERQRPAMPTDLNERVLQRMDEKPRRRVVPLWRWAMAAAACAAVVWMVVGWPFSSTEGQPTASVKPPRTEVAKPVARVVPAPVELPQEVEAVRTVAAVAAPPKAKAAEAPARSTTQVTDPHLMEEFVAKLAVALGAESEALGSTAADSDAEGMGYVFPYREDVDLFGRLLQAACHYDNTLPDFRLSFSSEQFLFGFRDGESGQQYLWMAEKADEKTLLYATHTSYGSPLPAECYYAFRDTHVSVIDYQYYNF